MFLAGSSPTNESTTFSLDVSRRKGIGLRVALISGFSAILVLMAVLAFDSIGALRPLEASNSQVRQDYLARARTLRKIRVSINQQHSHEGRNREAKVLYVWTGDQARVAPDFLAVINFDEDSLEYGKVITIVPVPAPGSSGNEPHHCHLSADKNILACGGLLALLRGQNSIFFFDVKDPVQPKFLFSTSGTLSNITDDFLPLSSGGFLVTQMGSHTGGTPGRLAEFDKHLNLIGEWPKYPPHHGFNPHGISARPEMNLLVTSDFIMPASTLDIVPGAPELRGSVRVWDFAERTITRTIEIPGAMGTMDIKLIPHDAEGRAFTAGMFDGLVYLVNPKTGEAKQVFDCEDIIPHIEVPVRGGMVQLLAMPRSGDRLLFASFQAGQVGMLDVSDPEHPFQNGIVNLGLNAGPHVITLTDDDKRLVVTDYFLNEDEFGKIHFEGDHHIHVIKVFKDHLELDPRFDLDFNTAFSTGPARPHGVAMK
jgi:56kDa selenium binding protein (SBP56)